MVTKVYFNSNFYDKPIINIGRIAFPKVRHPCLLWSLPEQSRLRESG